MFIFKQKGANVVQPPIKEARVAHSSVAIHCQWQLRQEWFPFISEDGRVFTFKTGTIGKESASSRNFLEKKVLEDHMHKFFPQGHFTFAGPPRTRALLYKKTGGKKQTTLSFSGELSFEPEWTKETAALAAREFEVPKGTKIVYIWPDLFDRDLLSSEPLYQKLYKLEGGGSGVGVLTPCPSCKSNAHVKVLAHSCQKGSIRSVIATDDPIFIDTPQYQCKNPICQNGKHSKFFSPHTREVWEAYPESVRQRYEDVIYTKVAGGNFGEQLVTEKFCLSILKGDILFLEKERELKGQHDQRFARAVQDYKWFVDHERALNQSLPSGRKIADDAFEELWPQFSEHRFCRDFTYPKKDKLKKIFTDTFNLLEDVLLQDLFSRTPGRFIHWDATYKFLMKTSDDPEAEEKLNACAIVWGEYGHMLSFAFAESEQNAVYQRLHYYIRKRCERLGGEAEVAKVQYGYSDVCCEGLNRPEHDHWFQKVWPGAMHWPLKDLLHGQMGITRETIGADHDLHRPFIRALADATMKYDEAGKTAAAKRYIKDKKSNLTVELAKEQVMKSRSYRKTILNGIPGKEELVEAVKSAFTKIHDEDERRALEAAINNKGYRRYFKKEIKDVQIGAKKALENSIKHAEKGCCSDPLPMNEMSVCIDPENPESEKIRLRSTSGGESNNKAINRLVDNIGIQGALLAYMKFLLRAFSWNLAKDLRLCKILGLDEPRTLEWYLHQALQKHCISYSKIKYPPKFDREKHMEPVGIYYGRRKEWDDIDLPIQMNMLMPLSSKSPPDTPASQHSSSSSSGSVAVSHHSGSGVTFPTAASPAESSPSKSPSGDGQGGSCETSTSLPLGQESGPAAAAVGSCEPAWNRALGRTGDTVSPAATCYRRLGGKTPTATALNNYFPSSHKLTDFQAKKFWDIVAHASLVSHGGEDAVAQTVVEAWNHQHTTLMWNGMGYGGKLRADYAKKLLREKGKSLIYNRLFPPPQPQQPFQAQLLPCQTASLPHQIQPFYAQQNWAQATSTSAGFPVAPPPWQNRGSFNAVQVPPLPATSPSKPKYKRQRWEKTVLIQKGKVSGLSRDDMRRALQELKEPSSGRNKEHFEQLLNQALAKQPDDFSMEFTYEYWS